MHNILHFYNVNRKIIWKIIIIFTVIILLIRFFNYMAYRESNDNNTIANILNKTTIESETENSNSSNAIVKNNISLVSGEEITTTDINNAKKIIEKFVNYCNDKNVENAYEMLAEDCKEIYPSLKIFEENYYKKLFETKKLCVIENWVNDTYRVTFSEDMLTTGKSINNGAYSEYMTIKKVNGEYKLNINNYIGKTILNNITTEKNITISVLEKDTYMDYEIYTLKIKNDSENDILLDSLYNNEGIYLVDSNNVKYKMFNNALLKNDVIINKGLSKEIKITFSNAYNINRELKAIVFSEVIINYKNEVDYNDNNIAELYVDL